MPFIASSSRYLEVAAFALICFSIFVVEFLGIAWFQHPSSTASLKQQSVHFRALQQRCCPIGLRDLNSKEPPSALSYHLLMPLAAFSLPSTSVYKPFGLKDSHRNSLGT